MKSVGLTRCAYHFAHPKDDAVMQVKDFIFFSSLLIYCSSVATTVPLLCPFCLLLLYCFVSFCLFFLYCQAQHFVSTVGLSSLHNSKTLQLMLDLESSDAKSPEEVWAWTQAFLSEIHILTGRPGIIYTGYYFWRDSVGGTTNLDAPLWIASYTKSKPAGIPKAWDSSGWTFWQFDDNGASTPGGSAGSIPGITGNVDVDYFKYDEATLAKFCFP